MKGITYFNDIIHNKAKLYKVVLILFLLIISIILCFALISNVRKDKIKGGVYYGINLGMNQEEVKELLNARSSGSDKMSLADGENGNDIYSFQNSHLLENSDYYVDEEYMFEGNNLDNIFINIKCFDASIADKMQKDIIEKFGNMYGEFELIDNNRCWKMADASIYMIDENPTHQIITMLIANE